MLGEKLSAQTTKQLLITTYKLRGNIFITFRPGQIVATSTRSRGVLPGPAICSTAGNNNNTIRISLRNIFPKLILLLVTISSQRTTYSQLQLKTHTSSPKQALGESPTSRMTSSKSVLQQRHLLCYESEPIP